MARGGDPKDALKRLAAEAALEYVEPGAVVGVGTGSTTNHFIDLLAAIRHRVDGVVASSEASARRLRECGLRVLELSELDEVPVYVDGADQSNPQLELIKGGGGALTREKVLAAASRRFVCIAHDSKLVDQLGRVPLPVEVIPVASRYVAGEIRRLGGRVVQRQGFTTDNGNWILDVHDLVIAEPAELERRLDQIAGAVTNGLFALRPADVLLLGTSGGVRTLGRPATGPG
jgi:ribose 5-phosphate isomerase A